MPYASSDSIIHSLGLRLVPIVLALLIAGWFYFSHTEQGPFGRQQTLGLSIEQEVKLGAQAFTEVLQKSEVIRDTPLERVVVEIGKNLQAAVNDPRFLHSLKPWSPPKVAFQWEYRLVRSKQVNAFCLPGGKVVVFTGIVPIAKDTGGLATVMGHEIAHALARHGSERIAQQQLANILQSGAAISLADLSPQKRQAILGALGAGLQYGLILPYSRAHESEADRIGLYLMAVAGYDPAASIPFWERMASASGGSAPPEFASTHPSHRTRIRDLGRWMSKARELYQATTTPRTNLPLPTQ